MVNNDHKAKVVDINFNNDDKAKVGSTCDQTICWCFKDKALLVNNNLIPAPRDPEDS